MRRPAQIWHRVRDRFWRDDGGNSTIEFVLTFPAVMALMLAGVELGILALHHSALERAVDLTVRDIRLGTGSAPQHDELKSLICQRAGFIDNCGANLRLEMVRADPRNWTGIDPTPDCTDQSEEVAPVRSFVNGRENELMILRACAKVEPLFPTAGLARYMALDGAGQYALMSTTAFVQEPE